MTRDEFDQLVKRLEQISLSRPRLYLTRVIALVALAYGYLGLLLLGSLAVLAATIALLIAVHNVAVLKLALLLIIASGGFFWAVLRGLWVKLAPPTGLPLKRNEAPELFALLDELRAALRCEPFHEVLLVPEHNAAVVQIPRLGIFGWHRNYLLLGLPLMQSLSPQEFKAVLAHEFAHCSGGHGSFANWLYRLRQTWERIFLQMSQHGTRGSGLITKFSNWFWPQFNAHSFVLARANEYEADACSVRLAGAPAAASALMRLPVDGSLIDEKFWPHIFSLANHEKEPPGNVMLSMAQALKAGVAPEDATQSLRQAFLLETNNSDTHPCLKDRLRAMGQLPACIDQGEFPCPPPPLEISAADVFLGAHAESAAQHMSQEWRKAMLPHWAERHEHTRKLASELEQLEQPGTTDTGNLWLKATKLMSLHDDTAAVPVIEQILAIDPKHVGANFVRGRVLLEKNNADGLAFLEKALETDPTLTPEAIELMHAFYTRTGQREKLRPLENRLDQFHDISELARVERSNITANDNFTPHDLTGEQLAEALKVFEAERDLGSAAIVRKVVQHLPSIPAYVVVLRVSVSWWKPRSEEANQNLVGRIVDKLSLPGYFVTFVDEKNLKAAATKVFAVPGSTVYTRNDTP